MKMYAELKRKSCSKCGEEKEATQFYKVAGGKRLRSECKTCTNAYHKRYRNTEEGAAATRRARLNYKLKPDNVLRDAQNKSEWARFKKYGMVKSDYAKMLNDQAYQCLICSKHHSKTKFGLVVDHCHLTGQVRGLLCDSCNRGLGFFTDSADTLTAAANYLTKFKK
jgi:hypothetical protein